MLIAEILTETNRALLWYLTNKPLSPEYEDSEWVQWVATNLAA
jgi:hypothetical protein